MVNNFRKRSLFVLMLCLGWLAVLPSVPLFIQRVSYNGEHYATAISIYSILLGGTSVFMPNFSTESVIIAGNKLLTDCKAQSVVNWAIVYGVAVLVVLFRAGYSVVHCRYNCFRNVQGINGFKLFELRNKLLKNTSALVITTCYYMAIMYFVFAWVVSGQCIDCIKEQTIVVLSVVQLNYIVLGYLVIVPIIICHLFVAKYSKVILQRSK